MKGEGMRLIGVVIAMIAMAGCSSGDNQQELNIAFDLNASSQDQQVMAGAVKRLVHACPGLVKYWGDTENAKAKVIDSKYYSENRDYNWQQFTEVTLRVKNPTSIIPAEYRAQGHNCSYRIGSGDLNGVIAIKRPCIAICTQKWIDESQQFISD